MGLPLNNQIDTVVRRLQTTLDLPAADLEAEVRAAFEEWEGARIRDFVPLFVERRLRDRRQPPRSA